MKTFVDVGQIFKKIPAFSLILSVLLSVSACQAPANMQQMQSQNKQLQQQLTQHQQEIDQLQVDKQQLQGDNQELKRIMSVLGTEKDSRTAENSLLRGQVREFVQHHIDALKEFLVKGNLLDYIGSELVERAGTEPEKRQAILLIDFANKVTSPGTLTGMGGIASAPTTLTTKVLRKVDNYWVVIWQSQVINFKHAGLNQVNFPVGVGVETGDIMAYYFPQGAPIHFDTGTGDTRYRAHDIRLGESIKKSSLDGAKYHSAYSLGVYGLLH